MKTIAQTLLIALLFITFNVLGEKNTPVQSEDKKPMNILFLIVDDLNSWLLEDPERYAGKVIAPNIKGLAESGVNFVKTYSASTVCTPSRTATLTSIAPWRSGVYGNGYSTAASPVVNESISLPYLFKKAGYYTAGAGKISHGYKITTKNPGVFDELYKQHGDPKPETPLNGWAKNKTGKPTSKDWGAYDIVPKEEISDWQYADFTIKQLQKKHDKPFFITCGIFRPHNPWYVPKEYIDKYPLEEIVIPEINKNDTNDIPEEAKKLISKNANILENIRKYSQHKEGIQHYLACTSFADEQIGRVLKALEDSPYKENTIVVLWTDHGWHLGEKDHWAKGTLWEEASHCLMMMKVPGVTKAGGICNRYVSLLDIYPTLTELTGLKNPEKQVDGTSLVPLLKNPKEKSESRALSAYNNHMSIRTEKYRYIRYIDGTEEFYDCTKDPHEWTNLVGNEKYKNELEEIRTKVPTLAEMTPEVGQKGDKKKK